MAPPSPVPKERIRDLNGAPLRPERDFVLHWMTAARRVRSNPALERAVELARALRKPLVVLEPLRVAYPYASDRLHAFVIAGMAENGRRLAGRALYHPYVEPASGAGKGLLEALAARACAVVTDDFPAFFVPRMLAAAAPRLDVRLEAVDGSCLVPFRLATRDFPTAHAYRRHLQKVLPAWLDRLPAEDPLARVRLPRLEALPPAIARRWPAAPAEALAAPAAFAARLPVDHSVAPAGEGGSAAAEARLRAWLRDGLPRYADLRNVPDEEGVASGLSPWLHFGHLGTFDVVRALLLAERWTPARLGRATGQREGFWGLSAGAEVFLDQLVTWRELGYAFCGRRADHAEYGSLPGWARATLAAHAADPRPRRYDRAALLEARTGDPLWNAAQRELVERGTIHGYLRMLWGKKVIEWSDGPEEALAILLELNDRFALDGRDPNSISGITWCFGRFDRPWGPERSIFGTVRWMSSDNTARKVRVRGYLARFGGQGAQGRLL